MQRHMHKNVVKRQRREAAAAAMEAEARVEELRRLREAKRLHEQRVQRWLDRDDRTSGPPSPIDIETEEEKMMKFDVVRF